MADDAETSLHPLPAFYTPAQVASHFGLSERAVRADPRKNGCRRVVGNRIFLAEQDLSSLLEVWWVKAAPSAPAPHGDYQKLLRMRSDSTAQALEFLEQRSKLRRPR